MSVCENRLVAHDSRQPEIAEFDVVIGIKEYIPGFQIAVEDLTACILSSVALVES